MNNTKFIIGGFIFILIALGAVILITSQGNLNNQNVSNEISATQLNQNQNTNQSTNNQANIETSGISFSEVQKNNTLQSCMVAYNNKVYKIPSDFATKHPGGAREITNACGKDITSSFNSVSQHNSTALTTLQEYYFAELAR